MSQQDLIEELFTEINAAVDLGSELDNSADASFDLSAKYDELRIQAAAIDGKYADIRIDIDALKRLGARSTAEVRDRIQSLENGAKSITGNVDSLSDSQAQMLRSLIQGEDTVNGHNDRIGLLEAKMTRAVEVITAHERALVVAKKTRLTITSLALVAIAVAGWGYLVLNTAADINAMGRLNQVENVLGIQ